MPRFQQYYRMALFLALLGTSTREVGAWVATTTTMSMSRYGRPTSNVPRSVSADNHQNIQDTEIHDLDGLDENDDDDQENKMSLEELQTVQADWMTELQALSKSSSSDPTAVPRAQQILSDMFELYVQYDEEPLLFPSVQVYNLLLETLAYSKDKDKDNNPEEAALECNRILSRMEDETNEFVARPNLETYTTVMDAWAMRQNPDQAREILNRLVAATTSSTTTDEPQQQPPIVEGYNKLIKAHGMAGEVQEAESILRDLLTKSMANQKTWVQTMKAYAPVQPERVPELFHELQQLAAAANDDDDDEFQPRTEAYNVLLRSMSQKGQPEESLSTLYQMMDQCQQQGNTGVRPNAETFRHVLLAHGRSGTNTTLSAAKIEQLVRLQEGLYASTQAEDLRPDRRLLELAMSLMARARGSHKAMRAKRLLERLVTNHSHSLEPPSLRCYYSLLSACAYTRSTTPETILETFQIAVTALKDCKEPDSACYGMFLKTCANLMPESSKRDQVVSNVFTKCRERGLVNEFVLTEFERASSQALQLKLLGGFLEDGVRLPAEWSANATE